MPLFLLNTLERVFHEISEKQAKDAAELEQERESPLFISVEQFRSTSNWKSNFLRGMKWNGSKLNLGIMSIQQMANWLK